MAGGELDDPADGMSVSLYRRLVPADFHCYQLNNLAENGASNDLIYDTTMRYLENPNNPRPDLVVIGWSQFNRIQWYLVDRWNKGAFWEINKLGVGIPVPEEYQNRYQHWKDHVEQGGHWHLVQSAYWHNKIFNLHSMLDHMRIPHLFFNAFDPFVTHHDQYHLDWQGCFMGPYEDTYIYTRWCEREGYQEITPGWQHYNADAHDRWASIMYDYMKNQNII